MAKRRATPQVCLLLTTLGLSSPLLPDAAFQKTETGILIGTVQYILEFRKLLELNSPCKLLVYSLDPDDVVIKSFTHPRK